MTDLYEAYNNQKRSRDRLVQFHTRFRRSTFSEIERLSDEYNVSKAKVVRHLVKKELGVADEDE